MSEILPWFRNANLQLDKAYQKNKLAHGLLICGPKQCGKSIYARTIAQSLMCRETTSLSQFCGKCKACHLFETGGHPDFYYVDKLTDAKGKQKQSIGIDQIRELTGHLVDTPQLDGWRVAIISSVTSMTTAAFNALLKTLEEPGKQTLLILLADNVGRVPATVRSRCQLVIPELERELVLLWLKEKSDCNQQELNQALNASYEAPFAALDFLNNHGASKQKAVFSALDGILQNRVQPHEFFSSVDIEDKDPALLLADYFYHVSSSQLTCKNGDMYQKLPQKMVFQLYDKVLDYRRAQYSGSNLQPKLQIEAILIQWFEIGRKIRR